MLMSSSAFATQCDWAWFKKGMCPGQNGSTIDVTLENYNRSYNNSLSQADADANAKAWSDAEASIRNSGNSRSSSFANSGDSAASAAGGAVDSTVQVDSNDYYSQVIDYEVAANRATLLVNDCQNGTDLSSVKFGVAVVRQDPACQFFRQSAGKYLLAAGMICTDFEASVVKGADPIANTTDCLRRRAELYQEAELIENEGLALVREQSKVGLIRRAWRKIF